MTCVFLIGSKFKGLYDFSKSFGCWLLSLSILFYSLLSAHAFEPEKDLGLSIQINFDGGSSCFMSIYYQALSASDRYYAGVRMDEGGSQVYSGGSLWSSFGMTDPLRFFDLPITAAFISQRCVPGSSPSDFTIERNIGAAGGGRAGFFQQAYMGIKFSYKNQCFEFAVEGLTNTRIIAKNGEPCSTSVNANAMISRAHALAANQNDLTFLLSGGSQNSLTGSGNEYGGNIEIAANPNHSFWFRARSTWSKNDISESNSIYGEAGTHYKFSPNLLVGMMIEIDRNTTKLEDTITENRGWLIGPYLVAKLPDQPLYLETRALYGRSSNELLVDGVKDEYDTNRFLFKTRIVGELIYDNYKLLPNISALYIYDNQRAYKDSSGLNIPAQSIGYSEFTAGLSVEIPVALDIGQFKVKAGFDFIYSDVTSDVLSSDELDNWNQLRGRVDLGFVYILSQNSNLDFNGFYSGIGAGNIDTIGFNFGVNVKF